MTTAPEKGAYACARNVFDDVSLKVVDHLTNALNPIREINENKLRKIYAQA